MEIEHKALLELIKRAYQAGFCDALAGDDVRSVDYRPWEEILVEIMLPQEPPKQPGV